MRCRLLPLVILLLVSTTVTALAYESNVTVSWRFGEPIVVTGPALNISQGSAILQGNLTDMGRDAPTVNVSFEWGLSPSLGFEKIIIEREAIGLFDIPLTGLEGNQLYYYRAKAVGNGTDYGVVLTFTTAVSFWQTSEGITLIVLLFLIILFIILSIVIHPIFLIIVGLVFLVVGVNTLPSFSSESWLPGFVSLIGLILIIFGIFATVKKEAL